MVTAIVKLKPIVRFREFPFGTVHDPSMREFLAAVPAADEDRLLAYLRSGHVLAIPMGADLPDWFDRADRANPLIGGQREGGATPMTDGVWFWPAGLIHFVEKYHVRLPREFMEYAAEHGWQVDRERVRQGSYEYDY